MNTQNSEIFPAYNFFLIPFLPAIALFISFPLQYFSKLLTVVDVSNSFAPTPFLFNKWSDCLK